MELIQLQLDTNDLEGTRIFYQDILSLELLGSDDTSVTFKAGNTELMFRQSDSKPVYHFAFTLPANKLAKAFDILTDKVTILALPDGGQIAAFTNWNAEAFYFYDNNGNILEYIVRHDLDNASDKPFTGASICHISEIGLVTDDVPGWAAQLNSRYGIPRFAKQPARDNFMAMGDDRGLFIIAARERHWYPTLLEAEVFPFVARFKDQHDKIHQLSYGL